MQIKCKYDDLVSPKKLIPHDKNRNKHPDDQIDRLAKLIEYQGVRAPIVVSKLSGKIVKGHGTLEALKKLKLKEIPVVFQDFDSEEQEYAFLQSDNAIASWADLDLSGINADLEMLGPDFDVDLLGIKDFVLEPADKYKEEIEDDVPEIDKTKTISKLGDIYELGAHRLMCGDSTDKATVEKLMNGEKADMVFTDPPYGMHLDTDYSKMPSTKAEGNKTYKKVAGDADDFKPELIQTIFAAFPYCPEIFIFGADYFAELLVNKNEGSWVVWDKRIEEKFDKMFGSAFELCWSKNKHKREIARFNNTLFGGDIEARGKVHPTQKPTKLIEWFFDKWGKPQNKVVDLFGGSGSTLIACEKTNRKCFMMELDPHYIDVIVTRWCKYTSKTEIKRNGAKIDWIIDA